VLLFSMPVKNREVARLFFFFGALWPMALRRASLGPVSFFVERFCGLAITRYYNRRNTRRTHVVSAGHLVRGLRGAGPLARERQRRKRGELVLDFLRAY